MARSFTDDYLLYLLARASEVVSREFHDSLRPDGISVPYWRVLATLSDRDGMTIGELADIVLMQQPTLTKVIDRMMRDGLVTREHDSDDRRRVLVRISSVGRKKVGNLLARARQHEQSVLDGYDGDAERLKDVLRSLIDRRLSDRNAGSTTPA